MKPATASSGPFPAIRSTEPMKKNSMPRLVYSRDWPSAAEHADRALALAPTMDPLKGERALVELWQNGNLVPLQKISANLTAYGDQEGNLAWARWDTAMLSRDFAAAHTVIDSFPFETLPSVLVRLSPKRTWKAASGWGRGRMPEPRSSSRSCAPFDGS